MADSENKLEEQKDRLMDSFSLAGAVALTIGANALWYDTVMSRLDYGRESWVEQAFDYFD